MLTGTRKSTFERLTCRKFVSKEHGAILNYTQTVYCERCFKTKLYT